MFKSRNPDYFREYQRARYAANPEKALEARRAWYAANLEKVRQAARARYAANPEKFCDAERVRRRSTSPATAAFHILNVMTQLQTKGET